MAIDNVLTISTNELFRDEPFTLVGANIINRLGWVKFTPQTGDISYSTYGVAYEGSYGSTVIGVEQDTFMKGYSGDKIYIQAKYLFASVPSVSVANCEFSIGGLIINDGFVYPADAGSLKTVSKIMTIPENPASRDLTVQHIFNTVVGTNTGGYGHFVEYMGVINLTASYGKGNEPTLAQCETLYAELYKQEGGILLKDRIRDNILNDYQNGIVTASQDEIACLDVYDINGNKVLDFSKGGLLKVGDIVRIDKDNNGNSLLKKPNGEPRYFQIVERTFKKSGVPLLSLKYREVI
jgi:hypothetical protein